jgi:hypothetical protein
MSETKTTDIPEMLDTKAAASVLGVSPGSLEVDRSRRRWCIPHVRIGRKVLYKRSDLMAFIEQNRVEG